MKESVIANQLKECKAVYVSYNIFFYKVTQPCFYITSINNFRKAPVPTPEKKGFMAKLRKNASEAQANIDSAKAEKEKKKSKKK